MPPKAKRVRATAVLVDSTTAHYEDIEPLPSNQDSAVDQTVTKLRDKLVEKINKNFPLGKDLEVQAMTVQPILEAPDGPVVLVSPNDEGYCKTLRFIEDAKKRQAEEEGLRVAVDNLFAHLEELRQENAARNKQVDDLTKGNMALQNEILELKEQNAKLKEQNAKLNKALEAQWREQDAKLHKALEDQKKEFQKELKDQKKESEAENRRLKKELKDLKAELERTKEELEEVKEKATAERDNRVRLEQEMKKQKRAIEQIAARLMPIYLRGLLDRSRRKIASLLGKKVEDLMRSQPNDLFCSLETNKTKGPLSQATVVFLFDKDNVIRDDGNEAAHEASPDNIYKAMNETKCWYGPTNQGYMEQLFEFCFGTAFDQYQPSCPGFY